MLDTNNQLPLSMTSSPVSRLSTVLDQAQEFRDLLVLLHGPLFVNPSDLYAVLACETRLRKYGYDRTVSLCVFMADLYHDVVHRLDDIESEAPLRHAFHAIMVATINHYARTVEEAPGVASALEQLGSHDRIEVIHASFCSKFRDWRQMVRAARRMAPAREFEHSPEYGTLGRGVLVADRVGNMLAHLQHLYCDVAFRSTTLKLE